MSIFNATYMAGGRFDAPFMPTKPDPYVKGRILEIPGIVNLYEDSWTADKDYEMVSIAVDVSEFQIRDHWYFAINNVTICDEIYTKAVPEEIYLMATVAITAGDVLHFRFRNEGGHMKYATINYQLMRDLEA